MLNLILSCALAIPFAYLAWKTRTVACAVILALLPTYQVRFHVGPIPLTMLEVFLVALVAVWAFRRYREHGRSFSSLPWKWSSLLLLASAAVAVAVSPDHVSGLGYFKAYFLEPLLFFMVLWDTIETERHVRWLLFGVAVSMLATSLVALEQYVGLIPSLEPWIHETPKRVVGIFAYPNAVGLYLAPYIGLFAGFALLPKLSTDTKYTRYFFWGVIGLACIALACAFSRGAIFAVAIGFASLLMFSSYRKWIILLLGAGLALSLAVPMTRTIVTSVVTGTDVSTDVRHVLWQGTARLLQDRPIVGAGLGGFPILYDQYRLIKHTEFLEYPHNIVLNFWVELGLAGLMVVSWLFFDALRRIVRLLRSTPSPFAQRLLIGTMAALIIIIAHGVVDVPYFKNDLAVQFWFLLALIPIAGRLTSGQMP